MAEVVSVETILINGRTAAERDARKELAGAMLAMEGVPVTGHPARATALLLVSERVNAAVRLLRDVDGYPRADDDRDGSTVGVREGDDSRLVTAEVFGDPGHGSFHLELDVRVVHDVLGHDDSSGAGRPESVLRITVEGPGRGSADSSSRADGGASR